MAFPYYQGLLKSQSSYHFSLSVISRKQKEPKNKKRILTYMFSHLTTVAIKIKNINLYKDKMKQKTFTKYHVNFMKCVFCLY